MGIAETNTISLAQSHPQRTTGFLTAPVEQLRLSEVTTVAAVLEVNVRTVKSETKIA